ncbi:MAG: alpha-glucosidase C-terminal domain-containing protein, partial [Chloroflexi bacterium]|nr:alpha-glucosidase C-terminal domain-containing protein [Chloroflexota bacterium]
IRLDAVAYVWKELGTPCIHLSQTHALVRLIRAVLEEAAPGAALVTETNVPHTENVSYFGDGSNEATLVYNFALPPLVLHAFHSGDATRLLQWAQGLAVPSDRVTFLNFLASHDGIGLEPARGILEEAEIEAIVARAVRHGGLVSFKQNGAGARVPYELNINYFDALSDPFDRTEPPETQIDRFMAAEAVLLSLAGVPAIYIHSLLGSRSDRRGAEESGQPRRINRQKLAFDELERELADPNTRRARVLRRHANLLSLRRARRAFNPNSAQQILPCDRRVLAVLRTARGTEERVLCLHNVSNEFVAAQLNPQSGNAHWRDMIGGRVLPDTHGIVDFELQPYQVIWALREPAEGNG